jgi:hypothetical protein
MRDGQRILRRRGKVRRDAGAFPVAVGHDVDRARERQQQREAIAEVHGSDAVRAAPVASPTVIAVRVMFVAGESLQPAGGA